jgi:hypothetical protein
VVKPAKGFGVPSSQNQSQMTNLDLAKESPKFAQSSAFGRSGFQTTPAFGQSSFAQNTSSVFGQSGFAHISPASSGGHTGGAFAAFARGGNVGFGGATFGDGSSKAAFGGGLPFRQPHAWEPVQWWNSVGK